VNLVEPVEHVFDQELGFAVGVGRLEFGRFRNWDNFGFAVDGGRGTEDEALGSAGQDAFEEGERGCCVVPEIDFRIFHRFAGFDERGEM
jgi:hypothetical protein